MSPIISTLQCIWNVFEPSKILVECARYEAKIASYGGIIACDEAACGKLKVDTYKYFKEVYKNEK